MSFRPYIGRAGVVLFASFLCQFASPAIADEPPVPAAQALDIQLKGATSLFEQASAKANEAVTQALDLVGIRYRRGGTSPETGFDCSGFVGHVFRQGLGLILPRTSREISKSGEVVKKNELQPGDLVFFRTMRQAFSHVGIYLGDNLFVHAPASGGEVRIEDMRTGYWGKRFNGARRIASSE
ncbi:MAG: C40 family peptidase [Betaproteobacteria bacterium]|nr:C40 family peptidase [Betaproteobacteria bacterium]